MDSILTERQSKLLDFIIKEFVKTAKPVASDLIANKGNFDLSPATIRNEMYELEKAGYLEQLHTSGGRVPTDKAYRQFVNKLIEKEESGPLSDEKRKIKTVINSTEDPRELNKRIARTLSGLCDAAVIAKILNDNDFYKIGLSSLFEFPEFREMDRLFEVASLFDRFESIFDKMERDFFGQLDDEFRVFIGNENPLDYIRDESMILAKYYLPDDLRGSLTIIGPTRMDYEKNLALVKFTTEELNKLYAG